MDVPSHNKRVSNIKPHTDVKQDELEKLRELLLGDEYDELQNIRQCINTPKLYAESIANVLSEAINVRSKRDDSLTPALMHNVEQAIQVSVKKDPQPLVEAIFPIIGPAIRKSISETISAMLNNMNDLVEQSLSVKSLKWRLEAKRTGKSYAEVALLRTLDYQVEQVFLIHKETGLLLQNLISQRAVINDPDMVSGMLTAIQDFIADSFNVNPEDGLQSLRLGELTILIEQGPRAVIAAAVIGNPPADLGLTLRETVEKIHADMSFQLADFNGDNTVFNETHEHLEKCLRSQVRKDGKASEKKSPLAMWLIFIVIACSSAYWFVNSYIEQRNWMQLIHQLDAEPGFAILANSSDDEYRIKGLKDPLARNPDDFLDMKIVNTLGVQFDWQPYLSMQDEFILSRAKQIFGEQARTSMSIEQGVLHISGIASKSFIEKVQQRAPLLAGIRQVNSDQLSSIESYQNAFDSSRSKLEAIEFYFDQGATTLSADESNKLSVVSDAIHGLLNNSEIIPLIFTVHINGYTDASGTDDKNTIISQARADAVLHGLISMSLDSTLFYAAGLGAGKDESVDLSDNRPVKNLRRTSFKVHTQ